MPHYYPLLIPLAPLLAGVMMGLLGNRVGQKVYRIGVLGQVVALLASLLTLHTVTTRGAIHFPLFAPFGFYIDRLAAVMMVSITVFSTLVTLFSMRYMQQERRYSWFHALICFTSFALLCMVSSANLLMLFIFWQTLSGLLALLSFNYSHDKTVQGAFKTYTILRVGDAAFLAGIVLTYYIYGTLDLPQLFIRAADAPVVFSLGGIIEIKAVTAITLLIFIGAMSKSAQFPLHIWLPDALYAPTPVHALLHAGIINAGGFLLNRLAPLYGLSPTSLHVVFVIGMITTLFGSSMMLIQNDIKKTLGYSTIGQMGYMIMECGLGAFGLAVFHLIAHGLFKATIFLNCGNVIHAARQEPRLPFKNNAVEGIKFSNLTWFTGLITTLILPLVILLATHDILRINLADSQGNLVFLFFAWVTASQAILTLYRLRAVDSWKGVTTPAVAVIMLMTLLFIIATYLWAAESFSHFLYPVPDDVAYYFNVAAFPGWLFNALVVATGLFIFIGWVMIYAKSHGKTMQMPDVINGLQVRLYVLFMNRLYLDLLYLKLGRGFTRFSYRVGLIVLSLILPLMMGINGFSLVEIALFLGVALMMPLLELVPWTK